jgi:hypothetical protein
LHVPFDKSDFLLEFARKQVLRIWYSDRIVATLPLRGSHAAVMELLSCQSNVNAAMGGAPSDPFASSGGQGRGSDPFRR